MTSLNKHDTHPRQEHDLRHNNSLSRIIVLTTRPLISISKYTQSTTLPKLQIHIIMLPPKLQDGHEDNALSSSFQCAICLDIAMEPTFVTSCEHIFCQACITKSVRSGRPECPTCRRACDPSQLKRVESGALFRVWSNIFVKCGSCDDGCAWTGSMSV